MNTMSPWIQALFVMLGLLTFVAWIAGTTLLCAACTKYTGVKRAVAIVFTTLWFYLFFVGIFAFDK